MAFSISTDPFKVYRGTEEKIRDERTTPVTNGRIYFAYDSDKLFYDAANERHEISGGGDVNFIKANVVPVYDGTTGYYNFYRTDIQAKKLEPDNIILTVHESDSALYRVIAIVEETDMVTSQPTGRMLVQTKQISGGGGGGSSITNPLSFTTITPFPSRIIDTQDVSITVRVNSIITTDERCRITVEINGETITELTDYYPLRQELTFTIPHERYSISQDNEVKITAIVDENTKTKIDYFTAFHSEFSMPAFNPRQPYGTDVATGVANTIATSYKFSGLANIKGHIHMLIDGEELIDLSSESNTTIQRYGGGRISGDGQLNIPCNIEAFAGIEHGDHILTFNAYAVVNDVEYFVDTVSFNIIWATAAGGDQPIIISPYTNTQEENYNIINIPYVVYAKNTENITVHLYTNGEELATSPITVTYDKGLQTWKNWAISKYVPNIVNVFTMTAQVGNKTATKEFQVEITASDLMLDAQNENLILYLSALDRTNAESAISRQTWQYPENPGENEPVYKAEFHNFNWNNDGWQLDDNGDNVLRLNNGAYIDIPFTGIMQEDQPDPGFTIEVEFRCRNATSFAKLMTYESVAVQDTDEFGNLLWEQEVVIDQQTGEPVMRIVVDNLGNNVQKIDKVGHLAFKVVTGQDPETGNDITMTVYEHEDGEGNKTYYNGDNELIVDPETGDPIVYTAQQLTPIWEMEEVTQNKLDGNGNPIPIMVDDGAVEKRINYVTDPVTGVRSVANAVGSFFANEVGMCIGTQEAFFASTGKKVNVRYADNDKVKVSVVVDSSNQLLYIYINAVLSGVERFGLSDSFKAQGVTGLRFNSDYCDLDIYTIRIYNSPLNFDGIVQNWIGDAPNLVEKRQRYLENHITKIDSRNGYVTLDYELTKELSRKMAQNYKEQVALGNYTAQKGLPIAVISTYPVNLSNDTKSDLLPYNKAIKQYVDIRFWDPNEDVESFKVQDFELSVQGTSSQGYPRRNYKAKLKATKAETNSYANKFPFYFTTWDGDDAKKDIWPVVPDTEGMTSEQVEAATTAMWEEYKTQTGGYKQLSKIDIGNGTKETSFCFKADYMDSSSAHNTSLADYVDAMCIRTDTYNLIHPMRRNDLTKTYRQTVYGFPMLVFWDHKGQVTPPEFVGRYNFNTDKSATGSFGFTVGDTHPYMDGKVYTSPKLNAKGKAVKDAADLNLIPVVHDPSDEDYVAPTYEQICECWELTSNQHGFTGFRRNDFDALDNENHLDFYNFWENRYSIMDFDPDDMYKGDPSANKATAIANLKLYAKNIIDLSRWIYSTDVHPWDTNDETSINHHKLTQVANANGVKFTVDENDHVHLLRDYYTIDQGGTTVTKVDESRFSWEPDFGGDEPRLHLYEEGEEALGHPPEMSFSLLYEDEINAVLDEPAFYATRDEEVQAEWNGNTLGTHKAYYYANDEGHLVPPEWYHKVDVLAYPKVWNENTEQWEDDLSQTPQVVGYNTIIKDTSDKEYAMNELYEKYTRDTKEYRLSKYHAEFDQHLNFDYCAFYFILTEFMILYDSREKNMMIATWGPEEQDGNYIWYPIFYDMDTQLGINNSGTVYWDYDVNAQDEGLFSGAGSVLWDNFYACFLERIKQVYRTMRDRGFFNLENCKRYYNTESADRWTPIIKDVDAFYKYVAPSIDADGLRYTTKQGTQGITSSFFYCAQGDRTLNRSAFFRNRFNYKDSEWLGGSYRTQGGANIEMRYDANWTGTSDPDASDWTGPTDAATRTALDSNATFDIKPYLTQYCSVYYDEIPREGGRFDIQQEPVVVNGVPDLATQTKYAKNIANIKKSGFITIDPLPAIQETINNGMALSQQLVYIYGPEYIRDLGDLSLKYLDRFFCGDAIRLNRLQIGNDNPLYKNTGIVTGAFELDTAYYGSGGILNKNAKALLEYVDVSNLSGLTGALDLSGCLKLKTVKALGTKYNTITVPEGNVVQTLYLPSVTNTFVQIKSQRLSQIIRVKNLASDYYTGGNAAVGLYIENLTDRMNVSKDTDIIGKYLAAGSESTRGQNIQSNITSDTYYHNAAAPYYVSMKKMQIEGGALGLLSYEMLDYIVKQKIKMRYDSELANDTVYSKELLLRLLDVNWSPYEKIDALARDDRQNSDNQYFIRNDDLTYTALAADITFEYANKNLGGIYKKIDNKLSKDGGATFDASDATTYYEGIPNLDLLEMFIADYNNDTRTNTPDGINTSLYMVKDTYESNNVKFLPHIGGEIYLDNSVAIDEYELFQVAATYNEFLAVDDTPMTICAKLVTPCPRAKFIEISLDGEQKTISMTRSNDPTEAVTLPNDLLRQDYDFRGWATEAAIQEYEPTFLQKNGSGAVVSTTGGVVEMNSTLLDHLAVTVDQSTGNKTYQDAEGNSTNALLFGSSPVIYYAVFTLHKYAVTYVLDTEAYTNDPLDTSSYEVVLVPSNDWVDYYPPEHLPYYKNDTSPIGRMHSFIGWTTQGGIKPLNLHYQIRKDIVYYPLYQEVNAYQTPLDASYFDYYESPNGLNVGGTTSNGIIIYKLKRKVGGRICIPKAIDGRPVIAIYGSVYNTSTRQWSRTVSEAIGDGFVTEVYSADGKIGNGFQSNQEIEQIYFQGANDDTSQLRYIGKYAFYSMTNLSYIDFPNTLYQVGERGFFQCSKLAFNNINNIMNIQAYAFGACNTYDFDNDEGAWSSDHINMLTLNANMQISAGAINQSGWGTMYLGSQSDPHAINISNPICAGNPDKYYVNPMTGEVVSTTLRREFGCTHFILWSTVNTINDFSTGSNRIFSTADRNNYGDILSVEVYNP